MSEFFIKRPVFAWVIALFIILFGLISIPNLSVERYPSVAPPTVNIYATYPGATPQTLNDSVVSLIERELSSVKNLLYFESSSDTSGLATITATFKPGTEPDMAQVDVQNKIKAVESRLPQVVRQNGLMVESAETGFLMLISLNSPDGRYSESELNDYMARNLVEELRRISGVGRVQLFGAEAAMRIWIDPVKMLSYGLSVSDISQAITKQNAQIAPGSIGASPTIKGQRVTVPMTAEGQLSTPEQFAKIVLRANSNGSKVVLGDVAQIELGSQTYSYAVQEKGHAAASLAIQMSPGANAINTANNIKSRLAELNKAVPAGMNYSVSFDTSPFVKISIEKVIHTLLEAMLLVFLVMYLFLQNIRYTLIPAIVAPIALLGTFAVMLLAGFSINVLTMFGMVLAIGIIVDDAIVVVENVERLMATEGLSPKEASLKAMKEIKNAIVGITLVLTAVFIPMGFASGSVGVIYKQFTLTMAVSILFSAFLALTLTPALCATILKPVNREHSHTRFGIWFNKKFSALTQRYESGVVRIVKRPIRVMAMFVVIIVVLGFSFKNLPTGFLPDEDQGYFITSVQLPPDATLDRTLDVIKIYESHAKTRTAIDSYLSILGFGFSGSGSNMAMIFTTLKDWDKRGDATSASEILAADKAMSVVPEGTVMTLIPPAIDGLGNSSGFSLRLEDRMNLGHDKLKEAENQLLKLAAQSKKVKDVYSDGLPDGNSIHLNIDRQKAEALGVSFADISEILSTSIGTSYVNDFPNKGRMQQVIIQAKASARMQIDDVLKLYVRNNSGGMVSLSELVTPVWQPMPLQYVRYQGYPSARISGVPAAGVSSGDAMLEMEHLASQLPEGYVLEWTGQSLQERHSASQAPMLMVLSALVVFLVLAALYESWSVPLSVMLVVPLGLLGVAIAALVTGLPNDVFFKVGMITVMGLSAKNAILIIEFAKQMHEEGMNVVESAIKAASLRLRPIIMTSLAFGLGVVPLVLASGASAETQRAIGTSVFGGIITATVLAIFFVPVFFIVVMHVQKYVMHWKKPHRSEHQDNKS